MNRGLITLLLFTSMMVLPVTNASAYERWLRVHNNTSYDLCYVHISNVGTNSWGPDLLGPCIPPGYWQKVNPGYQRGYCMMDMKFVFEDDDVVFRNNYNICEGTDFYINE